MMAYILDLDGVIYRGSEVIAGAPDAVNRLLDSTRVVFLTNNSTQSRDAVSARLNASGIRCRERDVITAGYAAAVYIRKRYGEQKIYPIGESGLIRELEEQGHVIGSDCVIEDGMHILTSFIYGRRFGHVQFHHRQRSSHPRTLSARNMDDALSEGGCLRWRDPVRRSGMVRYDHTAWGACEERYARAMTGLGTILFWDSLCCGIF